MCVWEGSGGEEDRTAVGTYEWSGGLPKGPKAESTEPRTLPGDMVKRN
jgi:hypothetical protein